MSDAPTPVNPLPQAPAPGLSAAAELAILNMAMGSSSPAATPTTPAPVPLPQGAAAQSVTPPPPPKVGKIAGDPIDPKQLKVVITIEKRKTPSGKSQLCRVTSITNQSNSLARNVKVLGRFGDKVWGFVKPNEASSVFPPVGGRTDSHLRPGETREIVENHSRSERIEYPTGIAFIQPNATGEQRFSARQWGAKKVVYASRKTQLKRTALVLAATAGFVIPFLPSKNTEAPSTAKVATNTDTAAKTKSDAKDVKQAKAASLKASASTNAAAAHKAADSSTKGGSSPHQPKKAAAVADSTNATVANFAIVNLPGGGACTLKAGTKVSVKDSTPDEKGKVAVHIPESSTKGTSCEGKAIPPTVQILKQSIKIGEAPSRPTFAATSGAHNITPTPKG